MPEPLRRRRSSTTEAHRHALPHTLSFSGSLHRGPGFPRAPRRRHGPCGAAVRSPSRRGGHPGPSAIPPAGRHLGARGSGPGRGRGSLPAAGAARPAEKGRQVRGERGVTSASLPWSSVSWPLSTRFSLSMTPGSARLFPCSGTTSPSIQRAAAGYLRSAGRGGRGACWGM